MNVKCCVIIERSLFPFISYIAGISQLVLLSVQSKILVIACAKEEAGPLVGVILKSRYLAYKLTQPNNKDIMIKTIIRTKIRWGFPDGSNKWPQKLFIWQYFACVLLLTQNRDFYRVPKLNNRMVKKSLLFSQDNRIFKELSVH